MTVSSMASLAVEAGGFEDRCAVRVGAEQALRKSGDTLVNHTDANTKSLAHTHIQTHTHMHTERHTHRQRDTHSYTRPTGVPRVSFSDGIGQRA